MLAKLRVFLLTLGWLTDLRDRELALAVITADYAGLGRVVSFSPTVWVLLKCYASVVLKLPLHDITLVWIFIHSPAYCS